MSIYKQGLDRNQQLIFPPSLDELIDENNMVRAVDSYVEILNISNLKIKNKEEFNHRWSTSFSSKIIIKNLYLRIPK